MTLNKRYKRNIKSNFSFYLSIVILTSLVTCLHVTFDSSYGEQERDFRALFDEAFVEDAEFMTLAPISDPESLEKEFGVEIEVQPYIDLDRDGAGSEVRVFAPSKDINRYRV